MARVSSKRGASFQGRSSSDHRQIPKDGKAVRTDIYKSRFLDLRTLVGAEFGKPLSLKAACELKAFESKRHSNRILVSTAVPW